MGLSDHVLGNGTKTEIVGIMVAVGYANDMVLFYFLPQIDEFSLLPVKVDLSILESKGIKDIYRISWCAYNDKGVDYIGMCTNMGVFVCQISNASTNELKIDSIALLTERKASYLEWDDLNSLMAICDSDSFCWRVYDKKGNLEVSLYSK